MSAYLDDVKQLIKEEKMVCEQKLNLISLILAKAT